ncbi:MAG: type II toxin-antitoxin system RelE/ParE family toxin [Deltaproteobacteria bacterium]|nr:type II toxin-antitoxin system RelE/ParE family toxin [Deltaproteobacteria bacterium]
MAFPRRIEVTDTGKKSLKKLPPQVRMRILRKLAEYNEKPELMALNVKQLTDTDPPQFRLRVGDYRAVGTIDGERLILHVFIDRKDL